MDQSSLPDQLEAIAIIGMSGRFPGAPDLATYWANICAKVESITFFSEEELLAAGRNIGRISTPGYVKAKPILNAVDQFDANFFNISPREARLIDPQHRVFLEVAWQALENAGCDPARYDGWIGVFGGVGVNNYLLNNLWPNRHLLESIGSLAALTANDRDYLPTRVSYKFNLKGPSVNVQTACSTALVATHLACQSLLNYQCDMALAGGVSIPIPPLEGYEYQEGGIMSPDGHCRPFDAQAHGTIFGSGVGVIVLKRLSEALADGDHIHAIIRGSAINNDGSEKVGFTAPGLPGQRAVVAMAQASANINPETINYVEAHGTGTLLGDPIEVTALTQAFRLGTTRKQFCAIGSVKGNIGHTDTAAGVAGLIKTVLALQHRTLPPSINFVSPNPQIDFENSPFYVNTEVKPWLSDGGPRRAGVSAFGIGGTNAHIVVEEAPPVEPSEAADGEQLLLLSARTAGALEQMTDNLAAYLEEKPEINLADVAFTLQVGRQEFEHRRTVVARETAAAAQALRSRDARAIQQGVYQGQERQVVFLFSGQGAQYSQMGRDLYAQAPVFRAALDECAALLRPHLGLDLRQVLYPAAGREVDSAEKLAQTAFTQPALFSIEYALARLWQSWGIEPQAMIGHSIGEYVAATLAGVFSLENGLAVVAARGRLMQSLPGGAMLSVALSEEQSHPFLTPEVALAAINAPERCVISGPPEAIQSLQAHLTAAGVMCRPLHTSHAFHSTMMDPILETFTRVLEHIPLHPPQRPYLSNLTGDWVNAAQATDPHYWAQHLRQAVRFSDSVGRLAARPDLVWLEVGPGNTLKSLVYKHPARPADQPVLSSLRHPQEMQADDVFLYHTVGQLWLAGIRPDWAQLHQGARRRRVELPTYPFERERYWIDGPSDDEVLPQQQTLFKRSDRSRWFYLPSWKRSLPPVAEVDAAAKRWLVLGGEDWLSRRLFEALRSRGDWAAWGGQGDDFSAEALTYSLNPADPAHYGRLLADLKQQGFLPTHILHLWNISTERPTPDNGDPITAALTPSFYSPLYLAQAIGRHLDAPLKLFCLTTHGQKVFSQETLDPYKAPLLGVCQVIPQEMRQVACCVIDLLPPTDEAAGGALIQQLIHEFQDPASLSNRLAYRGYDRWEQSYEAVAVGSAENILAPGVRPGGVYLITGGLGGIGLTLSRHLAERFQARLVLTSRSPFPARQQWAHWLNTHDEQDSTSQRIHTLQALEAGGAHIQVVQADSANADHMTQVVRQTLEEFGALHGVIHAAGLPGGGLIQLKTAAMAERVLAPKVRGAAVLEEVLRAVPVDFILLCSSIASVVGGVGQVDYCAANAFLDAYAHAHHHSRRRVISVNWDAWAEVGMAVNTSPLYSAAVEHPEHSGKPVGHPILASRAYHGADTAVFDMTFAPDKDWVLAEHRLLGIPTAPGTTHLELVRAAVSLETQSQALEIREANFLAPLMVADGDRKTAQLLLQRQPGGYEFTVRSQAGVTPGGDIRWQIHALGKAGTYEPAALHPCLDVAAIQARCQMLEVDQEDMNKRLAENEVFLQFGPRWRLLRRVWQGQGEVLAELRLDERFEADIAAFQLHPAILDVATSFGIAYLAEALYLPLAYKNLRLYSELPSPCYCYIQYADNRRLDSETLTIPVVLTDTQGRYVAAIEEFTMKRVTDTGMGRLKEGGTTPPPQVANAYQRDLSFAILPKEGVDIFERILARQSLPQIVVSTRDLLTLIRQTNETGVEEWAMGSEMTLPTAKHARPSLATAYVTPRNAMETQLAAIWQDVLGIEAVGVEDDFFELGGDSLLAIQFTAQINEALKTTLPIRTLLEHTSVSALAAHVLAEYPEIGATLEQRTRLEELTPAQWPVLSDNLARPPYWAWLTAAPPGLTEAQAQAALAQVQARHAALRPSPLQSITLPPGDAFRSALNDRLDELAAQLDPQRDPAWRLVLFHSADAAQQVAAWLAHPAVADWRSLTILAEEWRAALTAAGTASRGPVSDDDGLAAWRQTYARLAANASADYWLTPSRDHIPPLLAKTPGPYDRRQGMEMALAPADSARLQQLLAGRHDISWANVLAATLGYSLGQWAGRTRLLLHVIDQARDSLAQAEGLSLQDTVGPLSYAFPLLVELDEQLRLPQSWEAFQTQWRTLPQGGLGYGWLRSGQADAGLAARLAALPQPQVAFHYLGVIAEAEGWPPTAQSGPPWPLLPQDPPVALVTAAAWIGGRLATVWHFDPDWIAAESIQALHTSWMAALHNLLEGSLADRPALRPADFPEADLTPEQLQAFLGKLAK